MGKSSTKTNQKTTGTATTTPTAPGWIQGPYQDFLSQVTGFMNQNPNGAAPNALQTSAWSNAGNLTGNPAIAQGTNATRALTGYTPDQVTAQQLGQTDLTQYLSPYTQNVVDTTMAGLQRARDGLINQGSGAATMANAWGGSRHGVADAETNRGFLDTSAATLANLYNTGFSNAQDAARYDISNRLNTDTANADRNLAGAGFRLGAANQLYNQGTGADANSRANIATQGAMGADQQANSPYGQRLQMLQAISQLLGIQGSDFIGQNMTQSGTSSGTTKTNSGFNFGFNWGPFSFGT